MLTCSMGKTAKGGHPAAGTNPVCGGEGDFVGIMTVNANSWGSLKDVILG